MPLSVIHNVLMISPPGPGKTLLARSLPAILPFMTIDEALDVTHIYSMDDLLLEDSPLIRSRPFRAPHLTISHAGSVGGGTCPYPGEISLLTSACSSWMSCQSSACVSWK